MQPVTYTTIQCMYNVQCMYKFTVRIVSIYCNNNLIFSQTPLGGCPGVVWDNLLGCGTTKITEFDPFVFTEEKVLHLKERKGNKEVQGGDNQHKNRKGWDPQWVWFNTPHVMHAYLEISMNDWRFPTVHVSDSQTRLMEHSQDLTRGQALVVHYIH